VVVSPGSTNPVTSITITANESFFDVDFPYTNADPGTALIGDRVWSDVDADGRQDPGELGLAGVTIDLIGPGPAALAGAPAGPRGPRDDIGAERQLADLAHVPDGGERAQRVLVEAPAVGQGADHLVVEEDRRAAHAAHDARVLEAGIAAAEQHRVLLGQVVAHHVDHLDLEAIALLPEEHGDRVAPHARLDLIDGHGLGPAGRRHRGPARSRRRPR